MKNKLICFVTAIVMTILSLCFLQTKPNVAYASSAGTDVYTMYDGTNIYTNTTICGTTTGYGEFLLGDSLTLSTKAKTGFKLLGWQITYLEQGDSTISGVTEQTNSSNQTEQFLFSNLAPTGTAQFTKGTGIEQATITISFSDENSDGYYDTGSFDLSQIGSELKITAVYDYIYYDICIADNFQKIVALDSYQTIDIDANTKMYYLTHILDTVDTYQNVIIKKGTSYYSYPTVYCDNTTYYTIHNNNTQSGVMEQMVNIDNGAYRLSEVATPSILIDARADVYQGSNVDVVGMSITGDSVISLTKTATDNNYEIEQDGYKRTTKVTANIIVVDCNDKVLDLDVTYHNLYVLDLVSTIDSVLADVETEQKILNNTTVEYEYSQINVRSYFIKDVAQGGYGVSISVLDKIYKYVVEDDANYAIYQLNTINGKKVSTINFAKVVVSQNEQVTIDFTPFLYNIDFKFKLYDTSTNSLSDAVETYSLEATQYLSISNTSVTIQKTDASNNVGYIFYCFALSDNQISYTQNTEILVELNTERPQNITVYMLYVKAEYTLKVVNKTPLTLTNGSQTDYSIYQTKVEVERNKTKTTTSFYTSAFEENDNQCLLSQGILLHDKLTFTTILNSGFTFVGYNFVDDANYMSDAEAYSIEITDTIISQYASDMVLTIYLYQDYTSYTLKYYILKQEDTNKDINIYMADLSVNIGGTEYTETSALPSNITFAENDEQTEYSVTITGLKLYDTLVLGAVGKQNSYNVEETIQQYQYIYNRFTRNFITSLQDTIISDYSATYAHTVFGDDEIAVMFSMPSVRLSVEIDDVKALDLSKVIVYSNGAQIQKDENGYYALETGVTVLVELNPNGETAETIFAFGYNIKGYTYRSGSAESTITTNQLSYQFVSTGSVQRLTILTQKIAYNLKVYQHNDRSNTDLGYVAFGEDDYVTITIENATVSFDYPNGYEGYYIKTVYFKKNNTLNEYIQAEQSNDEQLTSYSYTFGTTGQSIELYSVVHNFGVTVGSDINLEMVVYYALHTYDIDIEYGIINPKGSLDDSVEYPSITLTYEVADDVGNWLIVDGLTSIKKITFCDIPYSSKVVLQVGQVANNNMSANGFTVNQYNERPNLLDYEYSIKSLTIKKLTSNEYLYYKLTYNSYLIKTICPEQEVTGKQGTPQVVITNASYTNGQLQNETLDSDNGDILSVSYGSNVIIYSNPNKTSGYRFSKLLYYKYEYKEYAYDASTWASDYNTLYIKQGFKYTKNVSLTYNDELDYYTYKKVLVTYSAYEQYTYDQSTWDSEYVSLYVLVDGEYVRNTNKEYDEQTDYYTCSIESYTDFGFDINNYYIEDGYIKFYIYYEYIDILLQYNSLNVSGYSLVNEQDNLEITPNMYATYTTSVQNDLGEARILSANESVTVQESQVKIKITLNKVIIKNQEYDLSSGLTLNSISLVTDDSGSFYPTLSADGSYNYGFTIKNYLSGITANGVFNIYFKYSLSSKRVTVTTNIGDESFYTDGSNDLFIMSYNNSEFGFKANEASSNNSKYLTDDLQFLGRTRISYAFVGKNASYGQYFEITGIKVYQAELNADGSLKTLASTKHLIAGDEISSSDYAKYGIEDLCFLTDTSNNSLVYRFVDNLVIELQVQPIIKFNNYASFENNVYVYQRAFQPDTTGNSVKQYLSTGINSTFDVETSTFLLEYMQLKYKVGETTYDSATNVGTYQIEFSFNTTETWINNIKLNVSISLVVIPRTITLRNLELTEKQTKIYDGTSSYGASVFIPYLSFDLGEGKYLGYETTNSILVLGVNTNDVQAKSTYTDAGIQIETRLANENLYYNVTLSNITISNSNYTLQTNSVVFYNCLQIKRKSITLSGLKVQDKIYDGTNIATIDTSSTCTWIGVVSDDDIREPITTNLLVKFADVNGAIGKDKQLEISNPETALQGADKNNYKVVIPTSKASIYPYELTINVEGYGTVRLFNQKGLTDNSKVNLIPISSQLEVELIYPDSSQYSQIYSKISKHLRNNNVFAIGYKLKLKVDNDYQEIPNELFLSVPKADRFTGVYYLAEDNSEKLNYNEANNNIIIDLSQVNFEVNTLYLTQQRVLLKLWQLILIIVSILFLIILIIIIIIIIRRKKDKEYSIHDTI